MKGKQIMKESKSISRECVLVKLSVGTYAGTVKCESVSRKAAKEAGADEDAISTILKAMDPKDRAEIMNARNRARAQWIKDSLPWMDNGMRLVPAGKYLKMRDALEACKADFEDAVKKMIGRYDEIKRKIATRLGTLETEARFPTPSGLAAKFRFYIRTSGVTSSADVRIDALPAEAVAQIQSESETNIREQLVESQREVLERVAEKLAKVIRKLSEVDDPTAEGKHFKDSLTANVKEICDDMKELNVVGSAKLDATLDRIGNAFAELDPEVLREKPEARDTVKQLAQGYIKELDEFEF